MTSLSKVLVVLAGLGFVLAALAAYMKIHILGISAEGFSRGCTNLALISIAVSLIFKK